MTPFVSNTQIQYSTLTYTHILSPPVYHRFLWWCVSPRSLSILLYYYYTTTACIYIYKPCLIPNSNSQKIEFFFLFFPFFFPFPFPSSLPSSSFPFSLPSSLFLSSSIPLVFLILISCGCRELSWTIKDPFFTVHLSLFTTSFLLKIHSL